MDTVEASPKFLKPSEALALLSGFNKQNQQDTSAKVQTTDWFALNLGAVANQKSGNFGLLITRECNKELIDSPHICQIPYSPKWLTGFINVRSHVVPVINLEHFFALEIVSAKTDASSSYHQRYGAKNHLPYVLYFDQGADSFAVQIHNFPQKMSIPDNCQLNPAPSFNKELTECISEVYRHHEGVWCVWNIDAFKRRLAGLSSSG